MNWADYSTYIFITSGLWFFALFLFVFPKNKKVLQDLLIFGGIISLAIFTIGFWINIERPPFRTLAETRLWYSIFISLTGIIIYYRWKLPWMLIYSLLMAVFFLFINFLNPDTFDKTLMPALQSPWFIPHVVVYIIAYALLSASAIISIKGLLLINKNKSIEKTIQLADNIVYIGFAFLTFGLLFGALWAKTAWGHYWTWDPKETWAFITWLFYLLYIHFRTKKNPNIKYSLWILALSFIILLICWFGVNYLPSAQNSIHKY